MKTSFARAAMLSLIALIAAPVSASIIVVNEDGGAALGGGSAQAFGFDATGSTKLIVALTAEENGTAPLGTPIVSFDGVALTEAVLEVDSSLGIQHASIFYLDNPNQLDGFITVEWGTEAVNGVGFGVLGVTGAALGGPSSTGTTQTAGGPAALTVDPVAGDLTIATFVTNGSVSPIDITEASVIDLYASDVGSANGAAAYEILTSGGPTSYSYTGSSTSRPAGVVAAFSAAPVVETVPEPSAVLLLSLGLVGVAVSSGRQRR